jgi:hypothetical protein
MSGNDAYEQYQREQQQKQQQCKKAAQQLQQATAKLHEAEQARLTAEQARLTIMAQAHKTGLSIRAIAEATRLSRSRVHQLLQTAENGRVASTDQG